MDKVLRDCWLEVVRGQALENLATGNITESMLHCIHDPCATCKYNTSPEGYFCEMEYFEPKPIEMYYDTDSMKPID